VSLYCTRVPFAGRYWPSATICSIPALSINASFKACVAIALAINASFRACDSIALAINTSFKACDSAQLSILLFLLLREDTQLIVAFSVCQSRRTVTQEWLILYIFRLSGVKTQDTRVQCLLKYRSWSQERIQRQLSQTRSPNSSSHISCEGEVIKWMVTCSSVAERCKNSFLKVNVKLKIFRKLECVLTSKYQRKLSYLAYDMR